MSNQWYISDEKRNKKHVLKNKAKFGRDGKANNVKINSRFVSKKHFEIIIDDGKPILLNHSTFGTMVNSKKVTSAKILKNGDTIAPQKNTDEKLRIFNLNMCKVRDKVVIDDNEEETDILDEIFKKEPWKITKRQEEIPEKRQKLSEFSPPTTPWNFSPHSYSNVTPGYANMTPYILPTSYQPVKTSPPCVTIYQRKPEKPNSITLKLSDTVDFNNCQIQ